MKELNNIAVTTVEQAVQILAYNDHLWEGFGPHGMDRKTVESLAEAPYAYTEKQGKLAVSLLKRYHTLFQKFGIDLTSLLNNPVFREPFRVIDYIKSIETIVENNEKQIILKFPYSAKIINLLRCLKNIKTQNLLPMIYDGETKKWTVSYTEIAVYFLTLIAIRYNFKILDQSLLDKYEEIKKEKIKFKTPCVDITNGLNFKNVNETFKEWWQKEHSTKKTILQYDQLKSLDLSIVGSFSIKTNDLATKIAVSKDRHLYIDRNRWTKKEFLNALLELDSLPALVTTGAEFTSYKDINELYEWYQVFEAVGIKPCEVVWGYNIEDAPDWRKRNHKDHFGCLCDSYPLEMSDEGREQIYDRWCDMQTHSKSSKYIDEHTKIIFIRTKIPRTLIKTNITIKSSFTMFDSGYWPTGTETLGRVVENLPKVLYYVTKSKMCLGNKKHEFL